MQLKTLLREYLEVKGQSVSPRYDFLPTFSNRHDLPVEIESVPWSRSDESERKIRFERRSDLQDFINCYLELEEECGVYSTITIDGMVVSISSQESLPSRFKSMIDEIAHETRGH